MGCLKLTYQTTELPLKVVYRKSVKSENIVQRFLSVDPALIPWQSPYATFNNNPIVFNDPLGDKIKGSRKQIRALKKRSDWGDIKSKYRGSLFRKSDKDLNVVQIKHNKKNIEK